jgi:Peptidase C13 family
LPAKASNHIPNPGGITSGDPVAEAGEGWERGSLAMTRRLGVALLALAALLVLAPTARATEPHPKVTVVAFGLYGNQSVFESEATAAARIVAERFGGASVTVRANTKERTDATIETLGAALDDAAKDMDAENDLLVVILSSHGGRAGLAVKPANGPEDTLWPPSLAAMLDHTRVRHRAVIISACYSGVFIPVLANADTLVITAADANHPSFGCEDGAQWTYFGEAFFDKAMRRTGSLKEAFALARVLVREREMFDNFAPSNPQLAGGENIALRFVGEAPVAVRPWPFP